MILTATKLLPLEHNSRIIDNGAVAFSHGSILNVGRVDKIIKKYPGHKIARLKNAVLMPGLVNLHTHLELPPLLDTIRAETFPEWVLNLIRAKSSLKNKHYKTAVQENIAALIHSGTTTVGEICTHGISPALLKMSGLRSVIYHELISMNPSNVGKSPLRPPLPKGGWGGLIQFGLSPHAPHTVSESALLQLKEIARQNKLRLSMHVAESKDEIRLLQGKRSGFEKLYQMAGWDVSWAPSAYSSIEYLKRLGLLNPGFLAVHTVQVTNDDINIIKKTRAPVAHCSRSNKETNVGRMPLKKFLDAGITVGLGTDSLASSPSLNMWDEMRYAYQIHRRSGISAEDIFRIATIGGAKALGLEKKLGTLEAGKKADIIAVPMPSKNTGDIYSDLLRETKTCIMTMVDGKFLFRV